MSHRVVAMKLSRHTHERGEEDIENEVFNGEQGGHCVVVEWNSNKVA